MWRKRHLKVHRKAAQKIGNGSIFEAEKVGENPILKEMLLLNRIEKCRLTSTNYIHLNVHCKKECSKRFFLNMEILNFRTISVFPE